MQQLKACSDAKHIIADDARNLADIEDLVELEAPTVALEQARPLSEVAALAARGGVRRPEARTAKRVSVACGSSRQYSARSRITAAEAGVRSSSVSSESHSSPSLLAHSG